MAETIPNVEPPEPTRLGEVIWLEPYPDLLLEELPDTTPGPDARIESREAISLAFITALQLLPPRQRGVLILRDVLGFHASEVAEMLETTEQSVTSALKRARAAMQDRLAESAQHEPPPEPNSPEEQRLVEKFTRALESGDIDGIVALMSEDAWLTMPPVPLEYQGRELCAKFLEMVAFRENRRYRLVPTRANGQPAFGVYMYDETSKLAHAFGLFVLTLAGEQITQFTRFDNGSLARFGLPRTLS